MSLGQFVGGYILFAFVSKVWWFVTLPGRFLARAFGLGGTAFNASGMMGILVLMLMIFHGGVTYVAHAGRNLYLSTFTEQKPVPLDLRHDLMLGLRVEKSVTYVPYVYKGGLLRMTITNDTPYPIHKLWFVCDAVGKLYPDSVERFNTNYLFQGVMPPGQTRTSEVQFEAPSGGAASVVCRLGGADVPYGWWEGIPRGAMEHREGHGPSHLYDHKTFKMNSEGVSERARLFLGKNLEPVGDPMAAVE